MKLHEAIGLELERREMEITFEFACRDDCLGKMVPSDLRQVVAERDRLRERNEALEKAARDVVERHKRIITKDHAHYGPQKFVDYASDEARALAALLEAEK